MTNQVAPQTVRPGQTLFLGSAVLSAQSVELESRGVKIVASRTLMSGQPMVTTYIVSGMVKVLA